MLRLDPEEVESTVFTLTAIGSVCLLFVIISLLLFFALAVVGDEYIFFTDAKAIITPLRLSEVAAHLFDGTWTYGAHPYVSSLIQALSMLLLGRDNFGWRFSNIYLSAVSIGLFYLFFKGFFSRRVAILAALLLAASHYLMNFSKIGYNNLQALFIMSLVLWLSAQGVRSPTARWASAWRVASMSTLGRCTCFPCLWS